ncbi:glyceraldehyde-3-phosphate dehydrogenase [Suillus subalutaceus]|uniref:glyceraldehyde-3-phosphate dehydrogenase n=1 Tax=Suillus subalutaceus TaxID=48586 RepID=UPI001B8772BC|nr:glyceraldehyde-3-phosphate dehydrogenase [Suillus subalutaceus]KAG1836294.1 glyceraldehyde-3-phosphate dehydrogenase [Suillus subalutaceus]
MGRMGRTFMRHAVQYQDIEVVAINDPVLKLDDMAAKFKSIPVHGNFEGDVHAGPSTYSVKASQEDINWGSVGANYIIESSGFFTTRGQVSSVEDLIIITAISNAPMFICGVNLDAYKPEYTVISSASSTTNCLAPIASIRAVDITDNKSLTNTIIPTYTEAAEVVGKIIPSLDDRFTCVIILFRSVGLALNVFVVVLNFVFQLEAEEGPLKGILLVPDNIMVSTNLLERTESTIFDPGVQFTVFDRSFKLVAYYGQ